MKTKSYQEVISELLGENYKSLLEDYNLPFQHELWHVNEYFKQRRFSTEEILNLAYFLENLIDTNQEGILSKLRNIRNEVHFQRCTETKNPDFFDVFNLYYKWNKEEFFLNLKDEGWTDLMLKDIFPVIFLISLGEYISIQKNTVHNSEYSLKINMHQVSWIKVASKAYQEFNNQTSWSPIEHCNSYNSWTRHGKFSEPKTFFEDYNTMSNQRIALIWKELKSRKKGFQKRWNNKFQKSNEFAIKHWDENKNNYKNKTEAATAIYEKLKDSGDKHLISEEQGIKTIIKWINEHEKGKDKEIHIGIPSKKIIEKLIEIENWLTKNRGYFFGWP